MKVSLNWLSDYIVGQLPSAEEIALKLTMHSFEIEGVEKIGEDFVIDVKTLPDRSHYALSHYGIAYEIVLVFGFTLKPKKEIKLPEVSKELVVEIEDSKLCRRYSSAVIKNIKVGPSPEWLKACLEAVGQKSINNIVDIANYVMLSIGQPTHIFDLDKLTTRQQNNKKTYNIQIQKLKKLEKFVALDNKEYELQEGTLAIADGNSGKTLAIAGVKGGRDAGVTEETTDILLESANFDPITVRKTGRALGLLTDAQKRFENEITPELTIQGLSDLISLITEIAGGTVEGFVDNYPKPVKSYKLGVSLREINETLGTGLKEKEVMDILERLRFEYKIVEPHSHVVEIAKSLVGKPYKYGASISYDAPLSFDCSSFTAYLYKEAGVQIPRISVDQFVWGESINEVDTIPGDLIFSNTHLNIHNIFHTESKEFLRGTKIEKTLDHVGVFIGEGKVIHAMEGGDGVVVIENINESERFQEVVGFRRMAKVDDMRFVITAPYERYDLRIKEDLIEEIGRIYGYEHIKAKLPKKSKAPKLNPEFALAETIRAKLIEDGYCEVYTYALRDKGEVELANPLANDKAFLRSNLKDGVKESLELNKRNKDLLGLKEIKIFEIGNVFNKDAEKTYVCIATEKEIKEFKIEDIRKEMGSEIKLGEITEFPEHKISKNKFKPISMYPFIVRDIAVWVPESTDKKRLISIIKDEGGELLVKEPMQFDEFTKEGRTSYAYRMIFQSMERTLTDEEVNIIMNRITEKMHANKGWQVR